MPIVEAAARIPHFRYANDLANLSGKRFVQCIEFLGRGQGSAAAAGSSVATTPGSTPSSAGSPSSGTNSTAASATPPQPTASSSTVSPVSPGGSPAPSLVTPKIDFASGLAGWTVNQTGGSATGQGTVAADVNGAVIREGDSFTVSLERTFTVLQQPAVLNFTYDNLSFDTAAKNSIKDAFEVSLLDSQGNSAVHTIGTGRDAFYNVSEGQSTAMGSETTQNGRTVTVDLSSLTVGSTYTVRFRLVNNDSDVNTSVRIDSIDLPGLPNHAPAGANNAVTTQENAAYTFAVGDFGFSDPNDTSPNRFLAVKVAKLPTAGTLTDNSIIVSAGQFVPVTDIAAGLLEFAPVTNAVGSPYDSFTFQVEDDGGTANGGVNLDPSPRTMTINVAAASAPLTVSNVSSTTANGTYGIGANISITVTFSGPVTVTGTPQIPLNSGGTAAFSRGNGGSTLTFTYIVGAGQNASPLEEVSTTSLSLNGGTITGGGGLAANLTLPAPGAAGSLSAGKNLVIDTTAPTVVHDYVLFGSQRYDLIGSNRLDLPWELSGMQVVFSEPIANGDMNSLSGVTATGFSGMGTSALTWTFSPLSIGRFATTLAASGMDAITDVAGNALNAGTGFPEDFNVLYGDVTGDGYVTSSDMLAAYQVATAGSYSIFSDLQGAGTVTMADVQIARGLNGDSLPAAQPGVVPAAAPAGSPSLLFGGTYPQTNTTSLLPNTPAGGITFLASAGATVVNGNAAGLSGNIVDASSSAQTIDLPVQLIGGSHTLDSAAGDLTFAAPIGQTGGANSIVVTGTGTVTLSGTDSYLGGTSVLSGKLVLSSPAALPGGTSLRVGAAATAILDGTPAGVLNASGDLLTQDTVAPDQNSLAFNAIDSGGQTATSTATVTGTSSQTAQVSFSQLSDLSASMLGDYGRTSYNPASRVLYADMAIENAGTYLVDTPLLVGIKNISDPAVRVRGADGATPDGIPYFNYSSLLAGSNFAPGGRSGSRTIEFYDPNQGHFTYDLVFLGKLNQPPTITTLPEVQAIVGQTYGYHAGASDPDGDPLTFSLDTAPKGMTIDAATGQIAWSPQQSDLGNETVLLQVSDGHGGTAQQQYTVSTTTAPPNRPPLITSTPVIQANVDTAYVYQASASDPDNDTLTFSLTNEPAGMVVDAKTGRASWTPTVGQLGIANVTLTVSDGRGGMATQSYTVNVLAQPTDQPPLITSDPVTQYNIPPTSNPPAGDVNPSAINLTLANGQTSDQTVSLTGLSGVPITLGNLVAGNFGTPGQEDIYTFALPSNALLYFDSLTNSTGFQWSLVGPNSALNISNRSFFASDGSSHSNPVLALPSGAYTLTVSTSDATTGPYAFRLSDLAAAVPLTVGTPVSDTLDPRASKLYQFNAVAGQTYYFESLAESGGLEFDSWRLIDPYGNALFKNIGSTGPFAQPDEAFLVNDGGRITATVTGTYTLLIEGFIKATLPLTYTVNVVPVTDTTQALTLGSTINGNLAPSQRDTYTFNLASNALLYFDALTDNGNLQWSLSGPPGTVVSSRSFGASDGQGISNPVLALPAGAYTLTVTGTGRTAGDYSFRLSDLATAATLPLGTPVSHTFDPNNSTDLYQFNAAGGQSFYFASLGQTGGNFRNSWRLIDPYGNVVFNSFLANDAGRLTLTAGGTYTLLVEGDLANTGTVSYSIDVAPITDATHALTLGSTVNSTLAAPGEQDYYTFNLAASSLLYFDAQTNNAGLQWSLSGPGGTADSNRSFTATDGRFIASDPVLPLPAGAYTLTISGTGQTAGAYAFRLSDLSAASTLPLNTPVNSALNPANSTNLYRFSANAGDQYTFTSQGGTSLQYWRLIDPYGNVVTGNILASNLGPLTLLATGTYYLLVEGFISDTGTANYTITAQFQGNTPPSVTQPARP